MLPAMSTSTAPTVRPLAPVLLVALSAGMCLLALYEWMELLLLAAGGSTVCSLNETVNCGAVWTSRFATQVNAVSGLPVAGWGLVYGVACLGSSLLLVNRLLSGVAAERSVAAVRLVAAVGLLACAGLFFVTLQLKAVCLLCLGTYALTFGFAAVAAFLLPGALLPLPRAHLPGAVAEAALLAAAAWVLLLYPGLRTRALKAPASTMGEGPLQLADFLAGLDGVSRKALGEELKAWQQRPVPAEAAKFPAREVEGPVDAPVRVAEFTDVLCGHCRALAEGLDAVVKAVPAGRLRVEPHQFPLDSECNRNIARSDGTGVRCAAARALVCMEGTGSYGTLSRKLFAEQQGLTRARVLELATSVGKLPAAQLEACMASPETQAKIDADIQLALAYGIQGTPLVVVNGREVSASPAVLYVLAVTSGNVADTALQALDQP
ncbi:MAG: thioredoxin domain-containing protein [Deltaproteobacteria bacterium]|nr:thioredoxin domain-containing protein [Deltaproteobacteria bacterium]